MSATAVASKKSPKKAGSKKVASHPTYLAMISKAITSLKERGGSSKYKILAYIMANFNVGSDARSVNNHLKVALRKGVAAGKLQHAKGGVGASGSFKVAEKATKAKKVKSPKKKATKPKKAAGTKKSPKKAKKSPAKKSKPAAAKKPKSPKKAKSPKKKSVKKVTKKAAKK